MRVGIREPTSPAVIRHFITNVGVTAFLERSEIAGRLNPCEDGSRLNTRRALPHDRIHETPILGVDESGGRPTCASNSGSRPITAMHSATTWIERAAHPNYSASGFARRIHPRKAMQIACSWRAARRSAKSRLANTQNTNFVAFQ